MKFVFLAKNTKQIVLGIFTGYLLLGTVGYLGQSVESWFGDVTDRTRFQGLDAAAFVDKESVYDSEAIDWINSNIEGRPVMLEANADSYTYGNRVSVLTGLPTVLGWFTHEWLWKDSYEVVNERAEIVRQMYTADVGTMKALLEEYNVSYVYVGEEERTKYADVGINEEGLLSLGTIVFQNEGVYIVKLGTSSEQK